MKGEQYMGFHFTRKTQLDNGKCLITIYYWGVWIDTRFLLVDQTQLLASGYEVRQIVNGSQFYSSILIGV